MKYKPPADYPFSRERLEAEQMYRKACKARVVKVCDNVYSAIGYAFANIVWCWNSVK